MGRFFDLDSPVMRFLSRVTDLLWINILTLLCCLPVITAGAAFTAAHYVSIKMCRDEESYITREYFKSFKLNFRQSTLIWLMVLLAAVILGMDYYIMGHVELDIPKVLQWIIAAAGVLFLMVVLWVFPVQSRFDNKIFRTIKNAFSLSIAQFPRTLLMVVLYILPFACFLSYRIMPLFFFFGISTPIFLSAKLYNKMFKKLEDRIMEKNAEAGEAGQDEDDGGKDENKAGK